MARYRIRRIRFGDLGRWQPGEIIAATASESQAERLSTTLGPREELGVVIERPDGSLDWGDQITAPGEDRVDTAR